MPVRLLVILSTIENTDVWVSYSPGTGSVSLFSKVISSRLITSLLDSKNKPSLFKEVLYKVLSVIARSMYVKKYDLGKKQHYYNQLPQMY